MRQIEWAMWANEQAVVSGVYGYFPLMQTMYISLVAGGRWAYQGLLMGGILGVAGSFVNWQFAAYAIPTSLLILLLEWPRGKRKKGSTMERRFHKIPTIIVNKLGPVTRNYYIRFILHLVLSIPCCFLLPTIMGAMALMVAGIIYLVAALKGEMWIPVGLEETTPGSTNAAGVNLPTVAPPTKPPPRGPRAPSPRNDSAAIENITEENQI